MQEFYVSEERYERFAELPELKEQFSYGGIGEELDGGGPPIWVDLKGDKWLTMNQDMNSLIISSSGAGKSVSVMMPTIIGLASERQVKSGDVGSSFLVNDPKGEIFDKMSLYLKEQGYNVILLNFREPKYGQRFNPWELVTKLIKEGKNGAAGELVKALSEIVLLSSHSEKEPFWENTASSYMAGLALLLAEKAPESLSLRGIHELHIKGEERATKERSLKVYVDKIKDEYPTIYQLLEGTINAPSETYSSIASVFSTALMKCTFNEEVSEMISSSDFSVEDLVNKKSAVFLVSPDESTVYSSVISLIVKSIYTRLIDIAYKAGGTLPRKFNFLLDEFGNMARLDSGTMLSACRSRGIRFMLCIQDYNQLTSIYSVAGAGTIKANCDVLYYLYSPSVEVRKDISLRCGETILPYSNKTVPLLSMEQLGHFKKEQGQTLILLGRNHAYISYLPMIYQYEAAGKIKLGCVPMERRETASECPKSFDLESEVKEIVGEKLASVFAGLTRTEEMPRERVNEEDYIYKVGEFDEAVVEDETVKAGFPELDAVMLEIIINNMNEEE